MLNHAATGTGQIGGRAARLLGTGRKPAPMMRAGKFQNGQIHAV